MKIEVYNEWDHVNKAEVEGADEAVLTWDGEYRKGDMIEFSGLTPDKYYVVKVDAVIDPALVLIKEKNLPSIRLFSHETSRLNYISLICDQFPY